MNLVNPGARLILVGGNPMVRAINSAGNLVWKVGRPVLRNYAFGATRNAISKKLLKSHQIQVFWDETLGGYNSPHTSGVLKNDEIYIGSLGEFLNRVSPNKVKETTAEYKAWNRCTLNFCSQKGVGLLENFVRDYPRSKNILEAHYKMGHVYSQHTREYSKAINVYEKLVKLYPSSPQASVALSYFVHLYSCVGEEEKAFLYSQEWQKRPPHSRRWFHGPVTKYEILKKKILLFQATHLGLKGKIERAKSICNGIIADKDDPFAKVAKGLLSELEGSPDENYKFYLDYKIGEMLNRAEYILYEEGNLLAAARMYKEMAKKISNSIETAREDDLNYFQDDFEKISMALEDIKLRRTQLLSSDVLKFVVSLKEKRNTGTFLKYHQVEGYEYFDAQVDTWLQLLLLNSCSDVKEVRILLAGSLDMIDEETKTPWNRYLLMFKDEKGWQVIDNSNILNLSQTRFEAENYEDVLKILEDSAGLKIYSMPWKENIFADSLKEFYRPVSLFYPAMEIEKQKLIDETREMFEYLETAIKGKENEELKLFTFARAFSILPKNHFSALKEVDLDWLSRGRAKGEYSPRHQAISLDEAHLANSVHEIVHHWEWIVTTGEGGRSPLLDNPLPIFYHISWAKLPWGNWRRWADAKKEDFAREYGMKNEGEDLATSAESYVTGIGNLTRENVREQMGRGKFELATKYLFNKYVRSFDIEDGLCFEYKIAATDRPLTLNEVKGKLENWLKDHPDSVPQSTILTIQKIEARYALLKRLGEEWSELRSQQQDNREKLRKRDT